MWAFLLSLNFRTIIIGVVGIAAALLIAAFLWQRASLASAEAKVKELTEDNVVKEELIGELKKNIKEVKKHVKRVEVIKYKWNTVRELVRVEVPATTTIIPGTIEPTEQEKEACKRYVDELQVRQKEMAKVQNMAGVITRYFNGELRDKDYTDLRAEILSKTGSAPSTGTDNNAATTP